MTETMAYQFDVMLDLETLSTLPNARILSIGAWPFRLDDGPVPFEPFYRNVAVESQDGAVDEAFYWWLKQSEAARLRLTNPEPVGSSEAVLDLYLWFEEIGGKDKEFRLWSHGTSFDVPILQSLYHDWGYNTPWKYNATRDTRTLFHAAGLDWDTADEMREPSHDALDDARCQATLVKRAWALLEPFRRSIATE
jgi:exodeoxyribonuclease VIII